MEGNGEKGQLGGLWSIVCVCVCVCVCMMCMYESELDLNCMSLTNLFLGDYACSVLMTYLTFCVSLCLFVINYGNIYCVLVGNRHVEESFA